MIVIMVILMLIGAAFIYLTQEERITFIKTQKRSEVFYAADAGVARGVAWLLNVAPSPEYYLQDTLNYVDPIETKVWEPLLVNGKNEHLMPGSSILYEISIKAGPFPSGITTNFGGMHRYYTVTAKATHPKTPDVFKAEDKISQEVVLNVRNVPSSGQPGDNPFSSDWPIIRSRKNKEAGVVDFIDAGLAWPENWETTHFFEEFEYKRLGTLATSWVNAENVARVLSEYEDPVTGQIGLGGLTYWKLPTLWQLLSIMDFRSGLDPGDSPNDPPYILGFDSGHIQKARTGQYWTSTPYGSSGEYYYVDFEKRDFGHADPSLQKYAIAVVPLMGDDRCLPFYENLGKNFEVHPNHSNILVDNRTGLMWLHELSSSERSKLTGNFDKVVEEVSKIEIGEYDGWRIPDIKELHSVMAFPASTPGTIFGSPGKYWSSTPYGSGQAWYIDVASGFSQKNQSLSSSAIGWPVRGPNIDKRSWKKSH